MTFLTSSWIVDGIIFLLTIVIAAYVYMTRNFQYWKKRGVVEIPPQAFFGNFSKCCTFKMSPGYLFKSFYEQSEDLPYVGVYILDKPCLLLRDPEIIKRVLVKDFNVFSEKFMHASDNDNLSNKALFLMGNPDWKFMKTKLSALFTSSKLKIIFESLQDVTRDFKNYMDSLGLEGSGKKINVKEISSKFTTDVIGITAFGIKLNSLTDPEAEFLKIGKKMSTINSLRRAIEVTSIFLIPQITTFFNFRFFERETREFFKKALKDILKDREELKIKRNDLIELLMQLRDSDENMNKESAFQFQDDHILAQAMTFFLAGTDSSATTMAFTLYELARNPDIQMKLRTEINNAIQSNNEEITYNMISDLQYLDMVIAETLRMYPPLPILDRKATSDYKIEDTGLLIEKGTPIFIPLLGLHYDPKYFTNPYVYDPENFSNFNKTSRSPYVYLPFGIGPRSCIAFRQALLQTKLGIAKIISKFEVALVPETLVEIDTKSFTTGTKKALVLNIRKVVTKTD